MRWVVGLGVLAVLISAGRAGEDDAVWRPYAGYVPGQEWARAAVLLVRDARTGEPIEGVRVRRCPEPVYDPESGWGPVWEETFTDEYGLAWVELDKEDVSYFLDPRTGDWVRHEDSTWTAHWVVDAPGYAPTEEYGDSVQEEIDLQPGTDVHGRIVDVFGRPAVGVKVEFKLGCAHAPSLRTGFTDRRGCFALPCIRFNADLCYEGPGVRAQYSAPESFAPTDLDVPTVIADPASAIVGRIVGPPRAWLAEASVQSRTSSRGPVARVSPDGWFRLEGARRREGLWLLHPDGPDEIEATLSPRDYRPGRPIVWHPPDPKTEVEPADVTVRVRGLRPDVWPDSLTIYFDRLRDGRRFRVAAEPDGESIVEAAGKVPPGTYELSAGWPFEAFAASPRSVEVKADGNVTYVLDVEERPRLEAVGRYELPEDAIVTS